jgi:hypothetical protein
VNRRIQLVLLLLAGFALKSAGQGTAFSYQGRLNDTGAPANAVYDFRFALYDNVTDGNQLGLLLTNSAVAVNNGLFDVTLDFGPDMFTGENAWLEIGVRAVGATNFTTLAPRQPVLPVPYAIFANGASNLLGNLSAAQLTGTVPAGRLAGNYPNLVDFTNGANNVAGTFSGSGAALTGLNASQLASGTVADVRLSSNVPLLNANQTFSGGNQFTGNNLFAGNNQFNGVNNFSNFGNSFSGSFFGNGLVGWIATNGPAIQAVRDHGYMITGPGLSTVILPPVSGAGLAPGDIIRVSGAGSGGWMVVTNAGETILGSFASYLNNYTLATNGGDYYDVAASADGSHLYTVGNGIAGVSASTDAGHTWNRVGSTYISGAYYSLACSVNGRIVYASPSGGGVVKKSTDSGATWSATTASTAAGAFIGCTADGGTLFTGNITCSGNGTNLAKLASGGISVSTNAGSTWLTIPSPGGVSCLAVSSDCSRLLAGTTGGTLYASSDLGSVWTAVAASAQAWSGAWMSPDGLKFAATISGSSPSGALDNFGVSVLPNVTGPGGIVSGSQGSAVELQYLGNGQFMPVSSAGTLWVN